MTMAWMLPLFPCYVLVQCFCFWYQSDFSLHIIYIMTFDLVPSAALPEIMTSNCFPTTNFGHGLYTNVWDLHLRLLLVMAISVPRYCVPLHIGSSCTRTRYGMSQVQSCLWRTLMNSSRENVSTIGGSTVPIWTLYMTSIVLPVMIIA